MKQTHKEFDIKTKNLDKYIHDTFTEGCNGILCKNCIYQMNIQMCDILVNISGELENERQSIRRSK